MFKNSRDSADFRRVASGVLLIAAPLLQLVAVLSSAGSTVTEYGPVTAPFWAATAGTVGWVGVRMLRMSREEWISYYPTAAPGRTTPDSYANTTA